MEEEDLSYLQPDFNPASLTIPRLRGILLTHGINCPSSAKKGDLVQIFNDELKPRARKILSAQKRIQRSSRGIEDAASTFSSSVDADEDGAASQPSPVKRGRGRPRKTEKVPEDDETDITLVTPPVPATTKKSRSRPSKSVERRALQRTPSATTPSTLKKEGSDPATWKHYGKDSPFSAENPFQSGGSSPPQPPATIKRRKTDGPISGDEKKKRASTTRRKTDKGSVVQRSSAVVNVPIPATSGDEEAEAGEEFEPSELAELELERRSGNTAVVPVRRANRSTGGGIVVPSIFSTLVAILGVFGYFWTQEKFQVGYCGIGQPSDNIAGYEIPEWAEVLRPTCEPCPQHGICFHNLRTECEKGFILNQNPLSLGGILPFTPTCEADGEKPKRVKAVADRVVDELRERKAQVECSGTDKEGKPVKSPEIAEEELKAHLHSKKKKGMSDEEFNDLWDEAIREVEGREEVVIIAEEDGQRRIQSLSTAKFPILCALRKSLLATLGRYSRPLLSVLGAILAVYAAYFKITSDRIAYAEAERLTRRVFTELADYASEVDDSFVSVTQMRDSVLRDEFSSARRQRAWRTVEKLVEQNANVRTKIGSLGSGDIGRGWRWIGANGSTGSGRRSSMYSRRVDDSSPGMEEATAKGTTPSTRGSDMAEFKRWRDHEEPKF